MSRTLKIFNARTGGALKGLIVEDVRAVRVYFVVNSRKAWNTSWSQMYSEGCFHLSLENAKEFVEKSRTKGTKFYIEELPSLVFIAENCFLVVTQVNTVNVLEDYFNNIEKFKNPFPIQAYSYFGRTFGEIYKHFNCDGPNWDYCPPEKNSVITNYCQNYQGQLDYLNVKSEFYVHYSRSYGGNYRLSWYEELSEQSATKVCQIEKDWCFFNNREPIDGPSLDELKRKNPSFFSPDFGERGEFTDYIIKKEKDYDCWVLKLKTKLGTDPVYEISDKLELKYLKHGW